MRSFFTKTFAFYCYFRSRSIHKNFLKKLTLLFVFGVFNLCVKGQESPDLVHVVGKVIDDETGKPVVSAKIEDNQSKVLGVTDVQGRFVIQAKSNHDIVVKMIGYEITYHKITDKSSDLVIRLHKSNIDIEEVVVTALNIERDKKALGYAVTTLSNEQLTDAMSNNWTEALSGKVPGLNLIRSNAGPTGSNSIILRGESNLTGSNDALIVVDGVVINGGSGRTVGTGSAYLEESAVDYGSGLNDINPDDIENVTVLKGPGAAALYGFRGANGAILITTKTGQKKDKGLGVTFNTNSSWAMINRVPDLQYEYGQGEDGINYYSYGATEDGLATHRTSKAYGPKFEGQYFYQFDPVTGKVGSERTLWRPYKNEGYNEFFETAQTFKNSVSIDGGSDRTTARFSFTNVKNNWIVPNTGYGRNTVALTANSRPSKDLQISAKANYTSKVSDNMPGSGYNNQTIMYGYIFWQPSAPMSWLKNYWEEGQENSAQRTPLTTGPDNPYLIAYEMLNTQNRNSLTGSANVTYTVMKDLDVSVRTAIDWANDTRTQRRPYDTNRLPKGMFRQQDIVSREINSDFLVKYKKDINHDFDINASLGGSILKNQYNRSSLAADSLLFPGVYTFANSASSLVARPYKSSFENQSLYGLVAGGYKGLAFLDFTLRKDWTSTLALPFGGGIGYGSIPLYYSVNGSLIFSDLFNLPIQINYLKLRGSFAGVGSGGDTPYGNSSDYESDPEYAGGLYNPSRLNNPYLKPLFTASYETGIEAKFLRNRVSLDLAFYLSNTKDQILVSLLDRSVGYSTFGTNAGEVRNKGIEIAIEGVPIKRRRGLTWTVNGTFSANQNIVMDLGDLEDFVLQRGPGSNGFITAYVGGSMGDLYGRGYLRSPEGDIVYDAGMPVISEELLYLGNTMPKWKAGIQNKFRYKRFSVGFLVDAQYGSKAYSLTQGKMAVQGKTRSTLPGRYNGIVGTGVVLNSDGSYSPNTVVAEDLSTYYDNHFGVNNVEGSVFSTDFIKLREARIDYTLNKNILTRLKLQRASVGIYGRDLFIFSKWPGFDPEFGTLSGSEVNRGFEIGQFPSTRSFGVNLTIGI